MSTNADTLRHILFVDARAHEIMREASNSASPDDATRSAHARLIGAFGPTIIDEDADGLVEARITPAGVRDVMRDIR